MPALVIGLARRPQQPQGQGPRGPNGASPPPATGRRRRTCRVCCAARAGTGASAPHARRAGGREAPALDDAHRPVGKISDQLGHARVSMTQDRYLGRRLTDRQTADILEDVFDVPEDENRPNSVQAGD
jgi:integrase